MNTFSIKDIENLSGVKAHTWRIWEQRFNLVMPHRKESNHRYYDSDELKKALRISYLYHLGIKISKLARLNEDDLQTMAVEMLTTENQNKFLVKELTEAAIDFNTASFTKVLDKAIDDLGLEQTILQVVFPYLQQIGMLWLTGHVIPAQEHFVSYLVMHRLLAGIDGLPMVKESEKSIVLFTPANEHHEIPLLFTRYLLKKKGTHTIYLGQNIEMETLVAYYETNPFTQLYFHLITNLSGKEPGDFVEKLAAQFTNVTIVMAGSETAKISQYPKQVKLLRNSEEILAWIDGL